MCLSSVVIPTYYSRLGAGIGIEGSHPGSPKPFGQLGEGGPAALFISAIRVLKRR
jgi:hypothetical protein